MTIHEILLRELTEHAYRYSDGKPFILSSGASSPEYLDCRTALSHPYILHLAAKYLGSKLHSTVEAVGGLTMGADPLAIALSLQPGPGIKWFSVRKEQKSHGRRRQIEGDVFPGNKVAVLEDVITTGASTLKAIRACEEAELEVCQVLALVDRGSGGIDSIRSAFPGDTEVGAMFTLAEIRQSYKARG